jgi:hypothetical protein
MGDLLAGAREDVPQGAELVDVLAGGLAGAAGLGRGGLRVTAASSGTPTPVTAAAGDQDSCSAGCKSK